MVALTSLRRMGQSVRFEECGAHPRVTGRMMRSHPERQYGERTDSNKTKQGMSHDVFGCGGIISESPLRSHRTP